METKEVKEVKPKKRANKQISESKEVKEIKEIYPDEYSFRTHLGVKLFPHQLKSVEMLRQKENFNIASFHDYTFTFNFCVFADIPGYGKSYSIVKLCTLDNTPEDTSGWKENTMQKVTDVDFRNEHLSYESNEYYTRIKTTFVLASSSIIYQWKEYFSKSNLKIKHVINIPDLQMDGSDDPKNFDVILVSAPRYNDYIRLIRLKQYMFRRFVFDEPQTTNINGMLDIKAKFTIFITATPEQLFRMRNSGRYNFIRGIFYHLEYRRDLFNHVIVKNDDNFVKSSFKMPETKIIIHKCINPGIIKALQNFVSSEIQVMIQAGNIKGAIEQLGGENVDDKSLIDIVTDKKKKYLKSIQEKINKMKAELSLEIKEKDKNDNKDNNDNNEYTEEYQDEIKEKVESFFKKGVEEFKKQSECKENKENKESKEEKDDKDKYTMKKIRIERMYNLLKNKEQAEKDISELKERYNEMVTGDCPICFSEIENPVMLPCCQYIFCGKCIFDWLKLKKTCCMCRQTTNVKNIVYIDKNKKDNNETRERKEEKEEKEDKESKESKESKEDSKPLSKSDTIIKIVKKGLSQDPEGKRFIIFSNYDETYTIIKNVFKDEGIHVKEIKGRSVTRSNSLESYRKGQYKVIFLNGSYNGAGINLECTTDIILYHEVSNDTREQIIGRGNRIGRQGSLTVHQLV